jgi:hypothetical protein
MHDLPGPVLSCLHYPLSQLPLQLSFFFFLFFLFFFKPLSNGRTPP